MKSRSPSRKTRQRGSTQRGRPSGKIHEDVALRYNEGKRRWGLVDFPSIEPMVEVLEFGTRKYSENNWKKGLDQMETVESMLRHTIALMEAIQGGDSDKEFDPESGLHHAAHIMCNCMFYMYHLKQKTFRNKEE